MEVRIPAVVEELGRVKISGTKGRRKALKEREVNVLSRTVAPIRCKNERKALRKDDISESDTPIDLPPIRDDGDSNDRASPATPKIIHTPPPPQPPQPLPPSRDIYTTHLAPILAHSNHPLTSFATWSSQLEPHFHLSKIAEASFGEVYRLSLRAPLPDFSTQDESVFKVIALAAPPIRGRGSEGAQGKEETSHLSSVEDGANEVRLLQRMTPIPGFTNFRDVRIVQGRPPPPFVEAYRAFDTVQRAIGKGGSNYPDPALEASHPQDQLWAVLEMQDAGTDLERLDESHNCHDVWRVWDIFWQVVLALAKGEEAVSFEHRDLHLGNICVREHTQAVGAEIDISGKLGFTGVEATVIDYTISRATLSDSSVAFQDLACDDALFEGDAEEEYQYDIYRYMRGAVLYGDAYAAPPFPARDAEAAGWEGFHPISNLVWLHFVLYKLLEQISWPSAAKAPAKKRRKEYSRWRRANELEGILLRVQELLDPGVLDAEGLRSTSDLVGLALEEEWLGVEDVVGVGDVVEQLAELSVSS